jgi:hypothetical protein
MIAPKCHGRGDLDMLPASGETQVQGRFEGFSRPVVPLVS